MEKKLIYLASPYSDSSSEVRQERFNKTCKIAAKFIKQGYLVFSPIAHTHNIAQFIGKGAVGFDYWRQSDLHILSYHDELWILELDGWDSSIGLREEIVYAKENNMPIFHVSKDGDLFAEASEQPNSNKTGQPLGANLFASVSQIINHDRQDSYGRPEDSFASIARRWTEYLYDRTITDLNKITPQNVAFMMMELKMARESNKHKMDNIEDLVGYAALMTEMEEEKNAR